MIDVAMFGKLTINFLFLLSKLISPSSIDEKEANYIFEYIIYHNCSCGVEKSDYTFDILDVCNSECKKVNCVCTRPFAN